MVAFDDFSNNINQSCFRQLIHTDSGYFLGRHVHEYHILNEINRGSYGIVHKARNNQTGEIVAMKEIIRGLTPSTLTEIDILESLPRHPSVVKFKEVVINERGDAFVVMEYLDKDLHRFMQVKGKGLMLSEVKFLMKQLLEGVCFLHKQGVMHRDLKPSNILVNEYGSLKICDFGMSCYFGSGLTQPPKSCCVGSRWYKAPELLLGDAYYSCAVDMWSVGCIMAELISKDVVFKGETEQDQLQHIWMYDMESWPLLNIRLRSFLTKSGYDLLERLLSVDPNKRITAQDALNHKWFKEYYGFSSYS